MLEGYLTGFVQPISIAYVQMLPLNVRPGLLASAEYPGLTGTESYMKGTGNMPVRDISNHILADSACPGGGGTTV